MAVKILLHRLLAFASLTNIGISCRESNTLAYYGFKTASAAYQDAFSRFLNDLT